MYIECKRDRRGCLAYAAEAARLVTAIMLLAPLGCGAAATRHPAAPAPRSDPRSVAEVRSAFRRHGIRLREDGFLAGPFHDPHYTELFGAGTRIDVRVYRKVQVTYTYLVIGTDNGRWRSAQARNVLAIWQGRDRPAVRAAIRELR